MLLNSLVPGLPDPHTEWMVLAMASTFSGNLTMTGSVATIIEVEPSKSEVAIGFREFLRVGVPITLATLVVGWAWLVGWGENGTTLTTEGTKRFDALRTHKELIATQGGRGETW